MNSNWTPAQEAYVTETYKTFSITDTHAHYNINFHTPRSIASIRRKVEVLKLHKSIEQRIAKTQLDKKKIYIESKKTHCAVCSYDAHPITLDFHNISGKDFALSDIARYSYTKIDSEIAKCLCLCSNCHRLLHIGEITL